MRDIVRENPSLRIRLVVNKSYSAVVAPTVINDTDMAPRHRQRGRLIPRKPAGKPHSGSSENTIAMKKCRKSWGDLVAPS